ncbi:MAG: Fic family protein [Elusimicrobiota bacterium]
MNEQLIKKVMTYKSGQFVFSRKYDDAVISKYLVQVELLYDTVMNVPILPQMLVRLDEELIIRSICGTAGIEGNIIDEEKVKQIINGNDQQKSTERKQREIENLKRVYKYINDLAEKNENNEITEDIIKKCHNIITEGINYNNNSPGQYRNSKVYVNNEEHGGVDVPPKIIEDIRNLMEQFISWINSEEMKSINPILRAGIAHYHLSRIHPFADGNGRTVRAIEAFILISSGIKYLPLLLSNYYYKNIDEYFWAFSNTRNNKEYDISAFLEFVLKGCLESLLEIKTYVFVFINRLVLRDYFHVLKEKRDINQRQFDLLNIMLDGNIDFSLPDLLNKSQFKGLYAKRSLKTVQRDVKNLEKNKLIFLKEEKYLLNINILKSLSFKKLK